VPSAESRAAGLAAQGLSAFGLAMRAISEEGVDRSIGDLIGRRTCAWDRRRAAWQSGPSRHDGCSGWKRLRSLSNRWQAQLDLNQLRRFGTVLIAWLAPIPTRIAAASDTDNTSDCTYSVGNEGMSTTVAVCPVHMISGMAG
jgi:hypothetical protein